MTKQPAENRRSITQVNRMLRSLIEAKTLEQYFWVGGAIQGLYQSDLGHCYFDLVDDKTRIRCMLPDNHRDALHFELEDNLDVEVYGDVRFYERGSQVQISVRDIRLRATSEPQPPAPSRAEPAASEMQPPAPKLPEVALADLLPQEPSRAVPAARKSKRKSHSWPEPAERKSKSEIPNWAKIALLILAAVFVFMMVLLRASM